MDDRSGVAAVATARVGGGLRRARRPMEPAPAGPSLRGRPTGGGSRPRAATLLAIAVACGSGCHDAGERPGVTFRDSAGVAIVDNPAEPPARWTLPAEPLLEVGVVEGDEAYQLSGVAGAVWSARDELVVANGATNELRFYDAAGRHVRSVGGEGEGPGEFAALASLELRGDSLVAQDGRGWRFTVFSDAGELLGTTPSDHPDIGLLADGGLVSYGILPEPPRETGAYARSNGVLVRHAGASVDTIARFRMFEAWMDPEVPGRSEPIFGHDTRVLVTGDRVYVADAAAYEIRILAVDGAPPRLVRRPGVERPLTDEDRARFINARTREYGDGPRAELFLPAYRRQPARPSMPAFGRSGLVDDRLPWLLVDPRERLWVLDYLAFPDETPTWTVYDADGRLIGALDVPVGVALLSVSDARAVGVRRDELDVEHVAVYALPERLAGGAR